MLVKQEFIKQLSYCNIIYYKILYQLNAVYIIIKFKNIIPLKME
jgi:hypothetical protein